MTKWTRHQRSVAIRGRHLVGRMLARYLYRRRLDIEPRLLSVLAKTLRLRSGATIVSIEQLREARQKDTVFVMGCGSSINSVSHAEWAHIADAGDVFSFNHFYKGQFLPVDYHACGEIGHVQNYDTVLRSRKHREAIKLYYHNTFSNPLYRNATYFLRHTLNSRGLPITTATWALYFSRVFQGKRLCLYSIDPHINKVAPPSESMSSISHHNATLSDVVNIAYLMGYRKIVLVGVDLYDRRYFWLAENQTRECDEQKGRSFSEVHETSKLIVRAMDVWNRCLGERGVRLYVYNPRSLLRAVLPLYTRHAQGDDRDES